MTLLHRHESLGNRTGPSWERLCAACYPASYSHPVRPTSGEPAPSTPSHASKDICLLDLYFLTSPWE